MFFCGIDEAGRGPVLGPLVIAGVVVTKEQEEKLIELGVKDSKLLTPEKREALFDVIQNVAHAHHILTCLPSEIDAAIRGTSNLNWFEADKSAIIINTLKPDVSYVDCPSPNLEAYRNYILKQLQDKTKLVVEHKADMKYISAAAASVLAKVTRDREVERIKKSIGIDFGSGYLSDPLTAAFLDEHWATHPELFRHSWSSYQRKVVARHQRSLTDF